MGEASLGHQAYCFGCHILDLRRAVLRGPSGAEISLRPKALDVLQCLIKNAGRIVSREELLETVWPGLHIDDDGVTQCVREIRRAIEDESQQVIRTIAKRGYLLDTQVYELAEASKPTRGPESQAYASQSMVQVPESDVPASFAAFSGYWVGIWDNHPLYSTSLTIETVNLTGEITGSYAFMSYPPLRIMTTIIDNTISFGSQYRFRFTLRPDYKLDGTRNDSGIFNTTVLTHS